ncbi:helix-turn-helix transcriptional regulator [Corynebacterium sp. Q4381]|uniref:helix-turn-helix domain-containing protein n=1 Tax=Corynebacterium sp. Marseille-Q4381 TaxID=3121597 RepID=UPI002FE6891A
MSELLPQSYWASYALTLGQRVKMLRQMRGLTQVRLAEIAGVSRSLVSNLERNDYNGSRAADPTISTIYRLAGALYVPPAALLPGAGVVVEKLCVVPSGDDVAVTVNWPAAPTDTARFADAYLKCGAPHGVDRFLA